MVEVEVAGGATASVKTIVAEEKGKRKQRPSTPGTKRAWNKPAANSPNSTAARCGL